MEQITEAEAVAEAEYHYTGNRKEIEASEYAGPPLLRLAV